MCLVLALFVFIVVGCDESKTNKNLAQDNLTKAEADQYIKELSMQLANLDPQTGHLNKTSHRNSLMKESVVNKLKNDEHVNISEVIEGSTDRIMVEGKPYQIVLEVLNDDQLEQMNKANSNMQLPGNGVIVDDDDVVTNTKTYPVYLVYDESATTPVTTEYWTLPYADDMDQVGSDFNNAFFQKIDAITYPVFTISMEEVATPLSKNVSSQLSKTNYSGYLVFKGVALKEGRDLVSDEEFELYFDQPQYKINGYYNKSPMDGFTTHLFDGQYRLDARNTVQVKYPDVNKSFRFFYFNWGRERQLRWYEMDDTQLIYLIGLTSDERTMIPWEDDSYAGGIAVNYPTIQIPHTNDSFKSVVFNSLYDVYSAANNSILFNQSIATSKGVELTANGQLIPWKDPDDQYSKAGVGGLSAGNVSGQTNIGQRYINTDEATNGKLAHIVWKLGYRAN